MSLPEIRLPLLSGMQAQPGNPNAGQLRQAGSGALAPMDWSPFGAVVPVLSGSPGAGASVFAAAVMDVLQRAGRCALLVDAAEPSRSGLARFAHTEGPLSTRTPPAPGTRVRYAWRGDALLARLETQLPPLAPVPVPAPAQWLPVAALNPLHTTVVDLGQQWVTGRTDALSGPGAWLREGKPGSPWPLPVLVVRATRPSLLAAEEALARFDPWLTSGEVVWPARLVVMASWKRRGWPPGVTGAAGSRVARLLNDAVFLPYDRDLELGGVTEDPIPPRIQAAVASLLDDWGLRHHISAHSPAPWLTNPHTRGYQA